MILNIEELLKYRCISEAIELIPQVGYSIQSKYRRSTPEELKAAVIKYSELYASKNGYRTRIVYSLLNGENTDKTTLKLIIEDGINELDLDTLMSMVKTKEDGEKIAFAISVLQDYIEYLTTGKWKGPKCNYKNKEELEKVVEIRELAGTASIEFGITRSNIDSMNEKVVSSLAKLDKTALIKELTLTYAELAKRSDKNDNCSGKE